MVEGFTKESTLALRAVPPLTRGTKSDFYGGEFMLDEELIYDLADLFKIFSDSTRLKILCSLFENELNVTEITTATGASQTAVSHQLRILKQNHLVKYTRQGKQMVYSLADDHVKTIMNCGIEHLEE
mgnify:FL=1